MNFLDKNLYLSIPLHFCPTSPTLPSGINETRMQYPVSTMFKSLQQKIHPCFAPVEKLISTDLSAINVSQYWRIIFSFFFLRLEKNDEYQTIIRPEYLYFISLKRNGRIVFAFIFGKSIDRFWIHRFPFVLRLPWYSQNVLLSNIPQIYYRCRAEISNLPTAPINTHTQILKMRLQDGTKLLNSAYD